MTLITISEKDLLGQWPGDIDKIEWKLTRTLRQGLAETFGRPAASINIDGLLTRLEQKELIDIRNAENALTEVIITPTGLRTLEQYRAHEIENKAALAPQPRIT